MFKIKHLIRFLLEDNLKLRDNDNLLIAKVIEIYENKNLKDLSAIELLENLKAGKYGSLEGIRRTRQKWQEQDESLRGEKWEKRQASRRCIAEQLYFW